MLRERGRERMEGERSVGETCRKERSGLLPCHRSDHHHGSFRTNSCIDVDGFMLAAYVGSNEERAVRLSQKGEFWRLETDAGGYILYVYYSRNLG